MQALAYLKKGDAEFAQDCLEEGLHACELYSFHSGVFRMYNNLGVLSFHNGNAKKASKFFVLALDSLEQPLEYKQFPALTNLIQVGMYLKDDSLMQKAQKLCDEISSKEFMEYSKTMCSDTFETSEVESFSFFNFGRFSYIF